MGVIVAGGLAGLLNQSSAQVIDGSLKFNGGYLTRTPSSNGNRRTWTYSGWIKFDKNDAQSEPLLVAGNSSSDFTQIFTYKTQTSDIAISAKTGSSDKVEIASNNRLRDTGWYHIVVVFDSTGSGYQTNSTIYINGVEISRNTNTFAGGQNYESWVNSTAEPHYLGYLWNGNTFKGHMSQVYLIDGQALGPESFGYTDPLTNTWRPKKYTGSTNDTTYPNNINTNFSDNLTASSGFQSAYPAVNAFDGEYGTNNTMGRAAANNSGSSLTFSPSGGIVVNNKIEVFTRDGTITVNGGSAYTSNTDFTFKDISSVSPSTPFTLTSLVVTGASGNNAGEIYAIRIDGIVLKNNAGWGKNGFYLPMDGNSPIGDDKSGNGNNWTPVNFGGSVALDNPIVSGARPILNTGTGGTVARPGVFGSDVGAYYTVTVASVGGGNRYHFDGVDRPNPTLIRGATYTFDQSDSSNSNHPLRFATAADAAGSTQYTDGVVTNGTPGSAGAYTKITVPHNSPNTLHYYCTNHGGMGSSTSQITDETKADPYAWKCVLAMPLVGSNNDVSNQINSGSTAKTITVSNNAAASSDTSNFYNGSFEFDGTTDALTTSDLGGSVSQYTMECWINTDGLSQSQRPINASRDLNGNGYLYIETLTSKNIKIRQESTGVAESSGGVLSSGKWHHLALSYDGVRLRGFVDGVFVCQTSANGSPVSLPSVMKLRLGADESNLSSGDFDGYIQDARVYFGACKYTAATIGDQAFVVPATNPDILPDTPSGVSGGSKLDKVTDGAVSFDGSGDYLSVTGPGTLAASSNWCMECFFYCTGDASGTYRIMSTNESVDADAYTMFRIRLGQYQFYTDNAGSGTINTANFNKWTHIAITKSGTTVRGFVDGRKIWEATDNNSDVFTNLITGWGYGGEYFPGFISNARFVNGSSVYTADFTPPATPLTNITNTTHLYCQSNTSAIAAAVTPGTITANGNAAATNFNPFTTDINAVRGQETGYCTFNVLRERTAGYNPTFKDGNLFMDGRGDGTGTLSAQSGKFYFEVTVDTVGTAGQIFLGVQNAAYSGQERNWGNDNIAAIRDTGVFYGTGMTGTAGSYTAGDTMSFAFDVDNNKLYIAKNGVYFNSGVPSQGTGFTHSGIDFAGGYTPIVSDSNTGQKYRANFGQKPFNFPPPDGFQPLNAANIRPETVIARPDQYVGTTLYSGTGSTKSVTGVGHSPDLLWAKARGHGDYHTLIDSVRGTSKTIYSNSVDSQGTDATGVTSFDRDGFSLGANSTAGSVNVSGRSYVAWTWKAGGAPTATNDNTSGAMDSNSVSLDGVLQSAYTPSGSPTLYPKKMSIGTRQGFSIMEYEGPGSVKTLPHGLNSAPEFILVKRLEANASWAGYHVGAGNTKVFELNSSSSPNTSSSVWNSTTPTSSVWSIGNYADTGDSGGDYVAYLWHSVPGLQKFGSFVGNGSADGIFVETGFKVAWLLTKSTSNSRSWNIWDTSRDTYNPNDANLFAQNANAESSDPLHNVDMLSNGFKCRTGNVDRNGSGETYIYMAWAEVPEFGLYGSQSNAR